MPRTLRLFAVVCLAFTGCQSEEQQAELQRAGMRPILKIVPVYAKAGFTPTVEHDAVLKTLEASRALYLEKWDALTPESKASEFDKTFTDYVKVMRERDVKDAGLEFRGAWKRYLEAWDKFLEDMRVTPDGVYKDVEFMEALHAAFGAGGKDANRALSSDAVSAADKLKTALAKVYTAAETVGVNSRAA